MDPEGLRTAFETKHGVTVTRTVVPGTCCGVGAVPRRVLTAVEDGKALETLVEALENNDVRGDHTCLPRAILSMFPDMPEVQAFVLQNPVGPFSYTALSCSCPQRLLRAAG